MRILLRNRQCAAPYGTNVLVRAMVLFALLLFVPFQNAFATTFTTTVPGTSIVIPTTYPQAGGVVIVLEGVNGNVYYQFANPSTMFQGYSNSGTPVAWQGNPMQITPAMPLNCGFSSCSTYLGGGITRMTVRFTAYDGDNQTGMFDFNDLNLRINGSNFGANSGNWSPVATQNTNLAGTTLISSGTGFGNNTLDTGWFQSTDPTILANVLSTGSVTASIFDRDPADNYWDFKQGADANTSIVPLNVAPGVTLDKASTTTSFTTVGQIIPYTFAYRNIGSVWINNVAVSDPKVTGVVCPAPPPAGTAFLDPGETVVCNANYTVTQLDIDAGTLLNTATATGTPQAGSLGPVTDSNTIPGPASVPGIDLIKTALPSPFGAVGSTITYSFAIQNTGNVTLSTVAVSDPALPSLSCTIPSIAPGVTVNAVCTGNTKTVTQALVDLSTLSNTASVSAKAPNGASVSDTSTVVLSGPTRVPAITLVKTAGAITDLDGNGPDQGDTVAYSFLVNNTGNVTLTSVGVTDVKVGAVSCPVSVLAPGISTTCTGTYTLSQLDVNAGSVSNTATASGTPPVGGVISDVSGTAPNNDTATVKAIPRTPAMTIDKQSPTTNFNAVNNIINYSYIVKNTGNVTLTTPITIADNRTTAICPAMPVGGLLPTQTYTCSATYAVLQADIDAGGVTNIASASSGTVAGGALTSATDQVTVPAVKLPSMTLVKTPTSVNFTNIGDLVSYSYVVTNTGNTTLVTPVTITDNRIAPANITCPPWPVAGIAPTGTYTCNATYSVLFEDLDIGSLTNLAFATSGTTSSPQTSATIPVGANPALEIIKTSTATNFNNVGDVVPYSFSVRNSGNATFTRPITVTDNKIGTIACWAPIAGDLTFTPTDAPVVCSGNYTVVQADIDRGFVTNQAFASTTYGAANIPVTSPPDDLTLNAVQNPGITVTKSAVTLPITAVNQTLTYTITAKNTGDTTLSGVAITDPLIPSLSCSILTLAPNASLVCNGTYNVKQSDFDLGAVNNTATATASTPQGAGVNETGSISLPIVQNSSLAIAKAFISNADQDGSGSVSLNDTLSYRVTATNDGNVTQSNVVVSDALLTPSSLTCASLAPGQSCILNGSLNVSQTQVDLGTVQNSGAVTSTLLPAPETATRNVAVPQTASLAIDKKNPINGDQDTSSSVTLNDILTYEIVVTNTGNTTQSNVVITDPLISPSTTTCSSVSPGATCSLIGTKTVSQANVNSGAINNSASATSTQVPTAVSDSVSTPVAQRSSLTIGKALISNADQDTSSSITLNDTLSYRVTVTNDGTVTQNAVVVSDPLLTPNSITCATLAPNATCILNGTLNVSQAQVDNGAVANTGGVTSTLLPTSKTVSINTPISQMRALTVDKTSSTANYDAVLDVLSYSYLLRNTGNVTLTGAVSVTDNKTTVACPPLPPAGLAPGGTHTCTATYSATQADLDAGAVVNIASAKIGSTVSPTDTVSVPAVRLPALTVDKQSPTASFSAVNDVLTYSYTVRNTGNITLTTPVTIADNRTTVTCPPLTGGILSPNATLLCSATYVVTQQDIDAGGVTNIASASSGTVATGPVTSPNDQVTVPAVQTPRMAVTKRAVTVNFLNINDVVEYEYDVTNTGNTTLTSAITISDNRVSPVSCPPLPLTGLAPGDTLTCTATYLVKLEDLAIGSLTNLAASTSGTTTSPQTSVTIPTGANPALEITKTSTATSFNVVGDVIPFSFSVRNSGNASFTNAINVVDDKIGTIPCWTPTAGDPVFTPTDAPVVCSANYTVLQADIDRGYVTNQAYGATTFGAANIPVTSPPDDVTVNAVQNPAMLVSKSAATLPVTAVGQTLTYTITTNNSGDTTLFNVNVTDPLIPTLSCNVNALAPGADLVCTGTYKVTQDDFDLGRIDNTASASASTPQGVPVNQTGTLSTTTAAARPAVTIDKIAATSTYNAVGETLNYSFAVENTGDVTLSNVTVTDPLVPSFNCVIPKLLPGAIDSSCTTSYVVTQPDFDVGPLVNTASVAADAPRGTDPSASDSATVTGPLRQALVSVIKTATPQTYSAVGNRIDYDYLVTNGGNVTLNGPFSVFDDKLGAISCPATTTILPGRDITCTAFHLITQQDLDGGTITNTATASATSILGATSSAPNSATVTANQAPAISVVKRAGAITDLDANGPDKDDTIVYSFDVKNEGNVTLTAVGVVDTIVGPVSCPVTQLLPGQSTTCSATYALTQLNIDAGQVSNRATASGLPPTGPVVSDLSGATASEDAFIITSITQTPGIAVVKTAGAITDLDGNGPDAGDTLNYTFEVRNTGNTTLSSITVVDTQATVSGGPLNTLAPFTSDFATFTATYTLKQDDFDLGKFVNTAEASGNPPTGPPVKDKSGTALNNNTDTERLLPQSPNLVVVKTAGSIVDVDGNGPDEGDTIAYDFAVTNTGNVKLTDIQLNDPIIQAAELPGADRLAGLFAVAQLETDSIRTASTSTLDAPVNPNEKSSLPERLTAMLFGESVSVPQQFVALDVKRNFVRMTSSTAPLKAGDQLGVFFTLTNYGEGPLTAIAVEQAGAVAYGDKLDILAANTVDTANIIFTYTLTPDDIAAGNVVAPARVNFKSRDRYLSINLTSPTSLKDTSNSIDVLTASVTPTSFASLLPGATVNFSGIYSLKQSDVDAGFISNTAEASAQPPVGLRVKDKSGTAANNDTDTIVNIPQAPAIALVKTASAIADGDGNGPDAGDLITYTFVVSNEGNATLSSIAITDIKAGAISCPVTSLAPKATTTCSKTYALTQPDVDAGSVTNTATVSSSTQLGAPAVDDSGSAIGNDDDTVTAIPRSGKLTLVKVGGTPSVNLGVNPLVTDALDLLPYTFAVHNTGNVTLTGIAVADTNVPTIICPVTTLAPGDSTVCTGDHIIATTELNTGSVTNSATAGGDTPGPGSTRETDRSGTAENNDTDTVTPLPQVPAITVVKTAGAATIADGANNTITDENDSIEYSFEVKNTGNVTLTSVGVVDDKTTTVICPVSQLEPDETTVCLGTYLITQADLDLGQITNTATASGTPPNGTAISDVSGTAPNNDTKTVTALTQVPLVGAVKTAGAVNDLDGNGPDENDTIEYSFEVTNLGNVTLKAVRLTDTKVPTISCPPQDIAPATSVICTGTYVLTQADLDAGRVTNSATAFATPPVGPEVQDKSDDATPGAGANDDTVTSLTQTPRLTVVKTADLSGLTSANGNPGDVIQFNFTIKNTGTVTLTGITLAELVPNVTVTGTSIAKLAPGDSNSVTFTAAHTITSGDISAGFFENSAEATGHYSDESNIDQTKSDISGTAENNDLPTRVRLLATPSIALVKTAVFNDLFAPTGANVDDTVTYTLTATNTGNVALSTVNVTDVKLPGLSCSVGALAVGANLVCTGVYTLAQPDINAGTVENQAFVTSSATVGGVPRAVEDSSGSAAANDNPTVTTLPIPQATLSKTVNKSTAAIGDVLTFKIAATTIVFSPANIVDILPGGLTYVKGSAVVNGATVEPTVSGPRLTFNGIVPTGGAIEITLRAAVNASATTGTLTNRAQLIHPNGTVVATAQAKVEIRPEPVFDCGDIIGKVFDDKNSNGIQDDGEPGIPAARVTSVKGELITTDKYGRYHIACADIPDGKIGSNFILKLDTRSLPTGYRTTTENPRVVRLTRGKLTKINFGASVSRVIKLDLTDKVFAAGQVAIPAKIQAALTSLMTMLDEEPSTIRLQYHVGAEGKAIATERMNLLQSIIVNMWKEKDGRYKLPIETRLLQNTQKAAN
jgi:large repetitive protein